MAKKGHASIDPTIGVDTGTGAYQGPVGPTTHTAETDVSSTGAAVGPSEPTVYWSELHEGEDRSVLAAAENKIVKAKAAKTK